MEVDHDSDGDLPFPIYHESASVPGSGPVSLTATSWDDLCALKSFEKSISSHNICPASLLPPPISAMSPPFFAPCLVAGVPISDLLPSPPGALAPADLSCDEGGTDGGGDDVYDDSDPDAMSVSASHRPQQAASLPRPPDGSLGVPGAWTTDVERADGGERRLQTNGTGIQRASEAHDHERDWSPGKVGLPPWAVGEVEGEAMDTARSWADGEPDVREMMKAEYERGLLSGQEAEREGTLEKRTKMED